MLQREETLDDGGHGTPRAAWERLAVSVAGAWRRPLAQYHAAMLLVTGANGELGIPLLRLLGLRGIAARALVRSERAKAMVASHLASRPPEIVRVDYHDDAALARAAEGCDAVIHLVGIIKETRAARYADTHEGVTRALISALREVGGLRVVAASIVGADPNAANSCLASRGRSDALLMDSDLPALVLRAPMVLSPESPAARALYSRASGRAVWIGDGMSKEQPLDARDFVESTCTAALRGEPLTGAFEIAGPECLTHRDLVLRAASLLGTNPRPLHVPVTVVRWLARMAERFSANPPLTEAMLGVLLHDDEVDPSPLFQALGTTPRPLDDTLRHVLRREASRTSPQ